jgi:cytochrome P450 family 4
LIPAGTTLQCLTLAIHRNPEFFPDPLAYKPERFFPEEAIGRHPYAYIPFSAGPRNCIGNKSGSTKCDRISIESISPGPGQRFALLESKVVLSSLLRRYKFELSSYAKPPIPSYHVVLKSLTGINLVVSER